MMGSQTNKTNTLLKAGSSVSIRGAVGEVCPALLALVGPCWRQRSKSLWLAVWVDGSICSFHDFTHSVRCLHMFLLLLLCQWHLQYFNHTYSRSEVAILAKKCCFFITMFFFELVGRQLHNSAWNKFSLIKIRKIKKISSCNFNNIFY